MPLVTRTHYSLKGYQHRWSRDPIHASKLCTGILTYNSLLQDFYRRARLSMAVCCRLRLQSLISISLLPSEKALHNYFDGQPTRRRGQIGEEKEDKSLRLLMRVVNAPDLGCINPGKPGQTARADHDALAFIRRLANNQAPPR